MRALGRPLACFPPRLSEDERVLRQFLFDNMYRHDRVSRMSEQGRGIVRDLFHHYLEHPQKLPEDWCPEQVESGGISPGTARTVADFIAGMTDRFAIEEHKRLSSSAKTIASEK